jgi:hypothetical protein
MMAGRPPGSSSAWAFLAAPAATWPEAAEKARYVLALHAALLPAEDTRRRTLVAAVLEDFDRLGREGDPPT